MQSSFGIPLQILMVEDDQDAALLLADALRDWYVVNIIRVDNELAFRDALSKIKVNIVVCDFNIPGWDTESALRILRELKFDIPFILFTGTADEPTCKMMVSLGISDFVFKDDKRRLGPSIYFALERMYMHRDMQAVLVSLRGINEELEQQLKILKNKSIQDDGLREYMDDVINRMHETVVEVLGDKDESKE